MSEQQYDNTNSGALFKNDKKDTDKHPDYKGSLDVEGVDYWVSGWLKTGKSGVKFMSLALTAKDQQAAKPAAASKPAAAGSGFDDMGDDIPF